MEITFKIEDEPAAEKKTEPPPQPKEKIEEKPAPQEEIKLDIPSEEKPADKVSQQEVAKDTAPKEEKSKEKIAIKGTVLLEKNHFYVVVPGRAKRYRLVGLKKEQKDRLNKLQRKLVRFEIQVVSTESAKFDNAQLIKIGKVVTPPQEVAKETAPKEEKKEIAKDTTPKEKKPEKVAIKGTVLLEKNHYYVVVPGRAKRYRLVGLKKEQLDRLNKLQRKMVRFEIQVVSTESAKFDNAQLIKIGKVVTPQQEVAKEKPSSEKKPKEKPPKQEVAKETAPKKEKPKEKPKEQEIVKDTKPKEEKPAEVATSEETPPEMASPHKINEIIKIAGFVSVEKKEYYLLDPRSEIRYQLIDLEKEEKNQLKKLKGQRVNLELQVISNESATACSVQLIRFI
jgi:mannose/fructose/N-acetylgalactosamine-specific phosphotransferase system component IIB